METKVRSNKFTPHSSSLVSIQILDSRLEVKCKSNLLALNSTKNGSTITYSDANSKKPQSSGATFDFSLEPARHKLRLTASSTGKDKHDVVIKRELLIAPEYPYLVFNEADYCPVAIVLGEQSNNLYVAYTHNITLFTTSGEFLHELIQTTRDCFTDLAVSESAQQIACSLCYWKREDGHKFRRSDVITYTLSGETLYVINGGERAFLSPVLRVAFAPDHRLIIPDCALISIVEPGAGAVTERVIVPDLGTASRVKVTPKGDLVLLDGSKTQLLVMDNNNSICSTQFTDSSFGYSGLDVSSNGDIYVTNSVKGRLHIYDRLLIELIVIQLNDCLGWPVDIACLNEPKGDIAVADHLHRCIKVFALS